MFVIDVKSGVSLYIGHIYWASAQSDIAYRTITLPNILINIITQTLISISILIYYQPDSQNTQ